MTPQTTVIASAALTVALALPVSHASAQTPAAPSQADAERADALFAEGVSRGGKGDHAGACALFRESFALDPAMGTLYNIAECEARLGNDVAAATALDRLVRELPASDPRAGEAARKRAIIDQRVGRLTVTLAGTAPAGTRVTLGDRALTPGELGQPLPVAPGPHVVTAAFEGRYRSYDVSLRAGERLSVETSPEPDAGATSATVVATRATTPEQPAAASPGPGRTLGLVLAGTGMVGLGVSAFAGLQVLRLSRELDGQCADRRCKGDPAAEATARSGQTYSTVSTIAFAAGATLVTAGAVLFFASGSSQQASRAGRRFARRELRFGASASPNLVWVGAAHRW